MAVIRNVPFVLAVLASLLAVLYKPVMLRVEVLGINRRLDKIQNLHGEGLQVIPDSLYTEDLHYHTPSALLFGASEEKADTRWHWFPPIEHFNISHSLDRGTVVVIDPETKVAKRLILTNFDGPLITHGIDIWSPKDDANSVYIFVVNHLPNPAYVASNGTILPQARSQIELFHHSIGSSEANYLRSIWHPLIRTPNDIYAISANSIYITNDHHYRDGHLRTVEDLGFDLTPWANIVHLTLTSHTATTSSEGVDATIALSDIQNPNGLGHGKDDNEILINRAAAGVIEIAHPHPTAKGELEITESIQVECTIDNPSYFRDPYAKETDRDASGYVLAGLARACTFPSMQDPVLVWLVQRSLDGSFEKKKIFEDDGKAISTASTAVIVAIDPATNGGKKQGWLFVTGPISLNAIVMRIDL